ncbi:MAG: hypothetical protein JWN04_2869, partial [Myxococcaceae bacterium]|nr:hypothetical protein [Myxococcaceae bacterium]
MFAALSFALLGVGPELGNVAHARDSVLLLEEEGLRPALCAALRIQLSDLADVQCRTAEPATDLATRIRLASGHVASEQRRLAVLLERDPEPNRVRMILVGTEPDRAVLAIESIEDREAPDVDRSLALKVRDVFELLEADVASTTPSAGLVRVLTPPRRAPSARPMRVLLEAGAALSAGAQTRAAGVLGVGART